MATFKQEMPPCGGYAPIEYRRVPLKKGWSIYLKLAAYIGMTALGWLGYHKTKRIITNEEIEMRCARLALVPLITAETDRAKLKQLKKNRDLEEEIMKDVEGWEVGKWKGMPVYYSVGPNEWYPVTACEYYAHSEESVQNFPPSILRNG